MYPTARLFQCTKLSDWKWGDVLGQQQHTHTLCHSSYDLLIRLPKTKKNTPPLHHLHQPLLLTQGRLDPCTVVLLVPDSNSTICVLQQKWRLTRPGYVFPSSFFLFPSSTIKLVFQCPLQPELSVIWLKTVPGVVIYCSSITLMCCSELCLSPLSRLSVTHSLLLGSSTQQFCIKICIKHSGAS